MVSYVRVNDTTIIKKITKSDKARGVIRLYVEIPRKLIEQHNLGLGDTIMLKVIKEDSENKGVL